MPRKFGMLWEVEVHSKSPLLDHAAKLLVSGARQLGIGGCARAATAVGWLIEGSLERADVERLATEVLCDRVTETVRFDHVGGDTLNRGPQGLGTVLNVLPRPGVTDPAAQSAMSAMELVGIRPTAVRSLRKYWLPQLDQADLDCIAWKLLANEAVHEVVIGPLAITQLTRGTPWNFSQTSVRLEGLDDRSFEALSRKLCLALSAIELSTVRDHFQTLGRDPYEIELETIAQTWSEHCCHKTLGCPVDHSGPRGPVHFDNLLKETIFAATAKVRAALGKDDWCVSVFRDNSGVVRFDDDHDICIKVETHNHPSAIEPYGGAATGLGGVIRDVLGTGLGAKPIANLDVFCVGLPDTSPHDLPAGVIHPKRLLDGVVAGVRDYGNRMGIPTIGGAVAFDQGYLANPLVYCGTVGIMPRGTAETRVQAGDFIVVAGGRTGRDGIHGATFSSEELSSTSEAQSGGSVQIGHAIHEKMLVDFILAASQARLFHAITDCGAGGLSSAVGEMGAELGARVDLDKVPLKYTGLSATEIWISEAQERMVLAVAPGDLDSLVKHAVAEGVEATAIGQFTGDGKIVLCWNGQTVGELDCGFLHDGRPKILRRARWNKSSFTPLEWTDQPAGSAQDLFEKMLLDLLSAPDVASKEWIIRQYDHEVQGTSVIKPLLGPGSGPADGSVVRGVLGQPRGVAIGIGIKHHLGRLDPYAMTAVALVEAISNVIACGADPSRIALLDNFCWGDCRTEEGMGSLVEACLACHDMALAFAAPFVSGKDSLNNVFRGTDSSGGIRELSIPPTLLATAMGQVADVRRAVTTDLKMAGSVLYLLGSTGSHFAGSQLEVLGGVRGGHIPSIDTVACNKLFHALAAAMQEGFVSACHDLSDGGLAVALAESVIGGMLGARVELGCVPCDGTSDDAKHCDWVRAFSETPARFLCEVPRSSAETFERLMHDVPYAAIGEVTSHDRLEIIGVAGDSVARVTIERLSDAWRRLSMRF